MCALSSVADDQNADNPSSSSSSSSVVDIPPPPPPPSLYIPPLEKGSRRVYLLRHGETEWNARGLMQGGGYDIPLNEAGRDQALSVGHILKNSIAADSSSNNRSGSNTIIIASSHLQRASETADIVQQVITTTSGDNNGDDNDDVRTPVTKRLVRNEFGEMRFGSLEGLALRGSEATKTTRETFRTVNERMTKDPDLRWPGEEGESVSEVATRAQQGMAMLLAESSGSTTSTTDTPPPATIVVVAHGRFNKVLLATQILRDQCRFGEIAQSNTCVNVFDVNPDGKWHSHYINYQGHVQNKR